MKDKLISDRQVIKAILDNKELFRFAEDIQRFAVIIEDLPSMDRPRGKWEVSCKDSVCSVCGKDEAEFICGTEDWYGYGLSNYCPNCGARMKGAEEEGINQTTQKLVREILKDFKIEAKIIPFKRLADDDDGTLPQTSGVIWTDNDIPTPTSYTISASIYDTPQTECSACDTCRWYNSGIPCGVEPSVCKREVTITPQTKSYYTDATHFGKAKGESITTNTTDTPQIKGKILENCWKEKLNERASH